MASSDRDLDDFSVDAIGRHQRQRPKPDLGTINRGLKPHPSESWTINEIREKAKEISSNNRGSDLCPIVDRKTLATYVWNNASDTPTITVPGWGPKFVAYECGDLSGFLGEARPASKDRNADAMILATRILNKDFKLDDYDLVCDSGALKGLFRICLKAAVNDPNSGDGDGFGFDDIKLRIDAQIVGKTLFLTREKIKLEPAAGVGPAFRRVCIEGSNIEDSSRDQIFRMVKSFKMGSLRILLTDEADAVQYPTKVAVPSVAKRTDEVGGVQVTLDGNWVGGNNVQQILFASLREGGDVKLESSKWMSQYLSGSPRFVGRHTGFVFEPQNLKLHSKLDEIKTLCGLDFGTVKQWTYNLGHVLAEMVSFARLRAGWMTHFAIVSDPDGGELMVYEYETREVVDCISKDIVTAISEDQ